MDVIIHLAAVTPDVAVRCIRKPDFTVNLTLTQRVFDYFLASESKKFIFFSSVKAVANSVGDEVLDEEAIPWPFFCLPLNKVRFKKLTDTYVVNNSKIKKALGIESLPVNARKGLLDTFNSFKELINQ